VTKTIHSNKPSKSRHAPPTQTIYPAQLMANPQFMMPPGVATDMSAFMMP